MKLSTVLLSGLIVGFLAMPVNAKPRWCAPNCPPPSTSSGSVSNTPTSHTNTHVRVYRTQKGLTEASRGGAVIINQQNRQYIRNNGIRGTQRTIKGY